MDKNPGFLPVYAVPHTTVTWLVRIITLLWILAVFILLLLLPVAFAIDDGYQVSYSRNPVNAVVFIGVYELCFLFFCGWLISSVKKHKGKAVVEMWVDDKGLHRKQKDGTLLSVLYDQLQALPKEGNYDVYPRNIGTGKYSQTVLMVHYRNETGNIAPRELEFDMNVWYAFYPANTMELRAAFFQNIANHHQRIRINPEVYSHYHIDPLTFRFNKRKYWMEWTCIFLLIIVVLSVIYWLV
ncbi:MAG: hypothetical protein LBE92_02510 [Chryseobacterium sp.]|jgi:hypothetical protein|uniref:hypothetical protein n=1 Tax=Chryseobacterium sp. TaxID=1871047 RepID=UPI0028240827|nr:hypothetical protein [Chryseobacterium sp.]MDR2234973.1 hypothetical protein [Chryseobacterium sp.]